MTDQEREEIREMKEMIEIMAEEIKTLEERVESLCSYDSYGNRL